VSTFTSPHLYDLRHRFWLKHKFISIKELKKNIKLNVTNSALRSVDKKGSIDSFLKEVKFVNLSPRVKKIKKLLIAKN